MVRAYPGLLASFACGLLLMGCDKPATPLPTDPKNAVAALVETCHGVLMGRDKMASALIHLQYDWNDGECDELFEQVILWTEGRMRVVRRNRQVDIRLPEGAWRLTPHADAVEHSAAMLEELDHLQGLLRAALLDPLYRAKKVEQSSPLVYRLTLDDDTVWKLEVKSFKPPKADAVLLPWKLEGPPGKLTWHEYLHTGITHLPLRMKLGEFGACLVSLEASELTLDESWFTDPLNPANQSPSKAPDLVRREGPRTAHQPGKPRIGYTRASCNLVLDDPGSWEERAEAWKRAGRHLHEQGQADDDLEFLFRHEGKLKYAIPFVMGGKKARPFVPDRDQKILRLPRERVVILRTGPMDLSKAETTARTILERYLAAHELEAAGPLRMRPFVEINFVASGDLVIDRVEVQFEQPIHAP